MSRCDAPFGVSSGRWLDVVVGSVIDAMSHVLCRTLIPTVSAFLADLENQNNRRPLAGP